MEVESLAAKPIEELTGYIPKELLDYGESQHPDVELFREIHDSFCVADLQTAKQLIERLPDTYSDWRDLLSIRLAYLEADYISMNQLIQRLTGRKQVGSELINLLYELIRLSKKYSFWNIPDSTVDDLSASWMQIFKGICSGSNTTILETIGDTINWYPESIREAVLEENGGTVNFDLIRFIMMSLHFREADLDNIELILEEIFEDSDFKYELFLIRARLDFLSGNFDSCLSCIILAENRNANLGLLEDTCTELLRLAEQGERGDSESLFAKALGEVLAGLQSKDSRNIHRTLVGRRDIRCEFSIVIPTNRSLQQVQKNLILAKQVAQSKGVRLCVSDNSGQADKRDFCRTHFQDQLTIRDSCEATDNWRTALKHVDSNFMGFMADDDVIIDLGTDLPTTLPNAYVGACPVILLKSPDKGFYAHRNFDLCQSDPLERIIQYSKQADGANSLLYSFWDTELFKNVETVTARHPCSAGYQDWVIVQAMLAEGKVLGLDSIGYVYNNNNWFGPEAAITEEITRLLVRADLPAELGSMMPLLRIIDLVCYFGRNNGFNLSVDDRIKLRNQLIRGAAGSKNDLDIPAVLEKILGDIKTISQDAYSRYVNYITETCIKI
jgi:predicted nuclease with TOPRIM domain